MTSQNLPEQPNLGQLKKQAKTLLRAARANDPSAIQRFRTIPRFAGTESSELSEFALHDAQSVIAREHGFASWNRMRAHIEAQSLSLEAALDQCIRSATDNVDTRA